MAAETSSGSSQNIRMLDANQVDLGLGNAAITFPAIRGIEGFEKPFAVQAVISLQSSVMTVVAVESIYANDEDLFDADLKIADFLTLL